MTQAPEPPPIDSASGSPSKDERLWGMIVHLASLCFFIPFGNIIVPIVIWTMKKEAMPFVDRQGKEAINFQITVIIACIGLAVTIIGMILIPVVAVVSVVFAIIAGLKANEGVEYRYPFALRLIK